MNALFSLTALPLAGVAIAFGTACFLLGLLSLSLFHRAIDEGLMKVPVTTFLSAITVVWALLLGFVGADTWNANGEAARLLKEERSAILRLEGIARADLLDRPDLHAAVEAYRRAVVGGEWGEGRNRRPDQEVDRAVELIRGAIVAAVRSGVPEVLAAKTISDFDELQDARNHRLGLGNTTLSTYKWHLLLVMTVLSHIAIAIVHADRPSAGRPALALFAVAAVMSLYLLALHAHPYDGSARLEPDRLVALR